MACGPHRKSTAAHSSVSRRPGPSKMPQPPQSMTTELAASRPNQVAGYFPGVVDWRGADFQTLPPLCSGSQPREPGFSGTIVRGFRELRGCEWGVSGWGFSRGWRYLLSAFLHALSCLPWMEGRARLQPFMGELWRTEAQRNSAMLGWGSKTCCAAGKEGTGAQGEAIGEVSEVGGRHLSWRSCL